MGILFKFVTMNDPLFYCPHPETGILLPEEVHHLVRVLRMRSGDTILVTSGDGTCYQAILQEVTPKKATYRLGSQMPHSPRPYQVKIAVAPTRKPDRNEWMVEKMVELGIDEIWFVKTTHTHLETFNRVVNPDRIDKIAIAAMKQSGQFKLPRFHIGVEWSDFLAQQGESRGFIAYVPEKGTASHLLSAAQGSTNSLVLIGPEGDFTPEEVEMATQSGFELVSLGATRLRTETAAVAACHILHLAQL